MILLNEIYINLDRESQQSQVGIKYVPIFKSGQQPKTFQNGNNFFIAFPFCGKRYFYKWYIKSTQSPYSFPKAIEDAFSCLFRLQNNEFSYLNEGKFLINNFSWIKYLKNRQIAMDDYIPSLKEQLAASPGFVFIGTQKEIHEYKDYQFLCEDFIDQNIGQSFCTFVYIVPQVIDILKLAQDIKRILNHNFIHIQIDCSFKCTRPYVFSVPRLEMCHASIPLGVIITPTEREKTFELFFQSLERVIKAYNEKNPEGILQFSIKNDVKFLSDQGTAEKSYYKQNNLHHCWCTRHLTGKSGAYSSLAQIESEIFMIRDSNDWESKRKIFFDRLKLEAINPNCQQKQQKKIVKFAMKIGLSKDLLSSTEPDNYIPIGNSDQNDDIVCYLPFLRDFSPNTDNSTEGLHNFYNDVNMNLTFEHRLVLLLQKVVAEVENKNWTGPLQRWFQRVKDNNSEPLLESCNCSLSQYLEGVFGIKFCFHCSH